MPTALSSRSLPAISKVRGRSLGRCGLTVSEIGFGTWGLGGARQGAIGYGPTDDAESLRALRRAYEQGVTFYDTSDLYGYGHSESLLGRAFGGKRRDIVIATKAGFRDASGTQDFSAAYLERALQRSLRRLQSDHVDVFLLHNPSVEQLREDGRILEMLTSFTRRGLARAVGVSVRSPADGLVLAADDRVDVMEVNFSLTDQRALACGLFDLCARQGIGVIVRTPLCFGFLTATVDEHTVFDADDHRRCWSVEQRARWKQAQEEFWSCASRPEQTPAQFALRFCLCYPAVSSAIPGMLTTAHVEDNVRASALGPLGAESRQQVENLYRKLDIFAGK